MVQEQAIVKVFNIIKMGSTILKDIADEKTALERVEELKNYIEIAQRAIADIRLLMEKYSALEGYINDNIEIINKIIPNIQKYSAIDLTLKWVEDLEKKIKDLKAIIEKFESQITNMINAIKKIEASKLAWEEEIKRIKTQYSL